MIETSVAQTVETIEREIARLKTVRPKLASRVDRAEHIIVVQLSTTNGSRPIKVRVHSDGSRSYAVRSGSKLRRYYTVTAENFGCDCPDSRRRHAACKHSIACWLLERTLRRPSGASKSAPCSGCGERTPYQDLIELHEDNHDNLTYFHGDHLCQECADAAGVIR